MKSVCLFVSFSLRVCCHRLVSYLYRTLSALFPFFPPVTFCVVLADPPLPCFLLALLCLSLAISSSSCFYISSSLRVLVEQDLLRCDVGKLRDTSSVISRVSVIPQKLCEKRFGVTPLFEVNSTFPRDICVLNKTIRVIFKIKFYIMPLYCSI